MLETIGIDRSTHDVYRALLLHPSWTLEDIARDTGLTDPEVRSALDRLTQLSLLHEAADHQFVPVSPEVGLSPLLLRREAELDEQRARLSQERAALATLATEYATLATHRTDSGVERLEGLDAVRVRLMELAHRASVEVRTFVPGGALSAAALEAGRPLDEQNLARGVRMKTVYLDSVRNDTPTVEYATWLASVGGETRTVPTLPMRMILCDHTAAVIPIDADDSRQGALLIRYPSMVRVLEELFDLVWESAVPLGTTPQELADDVPTDREAALLKMLAAGLTDEGIARKMGVSLRTVRRNTADLQKRLGVQSRFQAGAEAVRRGWL
ncbi:Bacterial regulatory proteins, luxR family [Streptomyces graminofaciens]|uniref:Bacterial regulatory proteins, luxR family n=1 Tax=Streptomyces graminofaciens TaxID=68212 RepID=A0ABN5VT09_9ACTN|nr:helix-turn-helix domain-containing protein [Streptomyces graminofaciens]BBC36333.1 Bacterial regulatory proteins, luxR family [Streptomyces graminofaciens]